ncbi:GNAT family N-acetyltransferase [Psychromarinibacter halotolerans]|uniref:GNAT family N-acetyltransferase n=1 Tax=Psychromarinibacter halotolerans TaxID=1775175 RepID=A0ABV7H087_9RHOB|nr:GNAT family N-acetyltransferase [Psychromarinibacter halotolerans]MDF0598299.1 GNAT family N-acetyltransferase [Psychromarinibacter halotolerans]
MTPALRIGPARPRDAARLGRILGDWVRETPWMPRLHSRVEDREHLANLIGRFEVLVARTWRGPRGFLVRDGEKVHAFHVMTAARGKGVGRSLMDTAKTRSSRLELWCFQQNTRALAFYAREGFAEAERTDGAGNDEKLPDVRLVWSREETAR